MTFCQNRFGGGERGEGGRGGRGEEGRGGAVERGDERGGCDCTHTNYYGRIIM